MVDAGHSADSSVRKCRTIHTIRFSWARQFESLMIVEFTDFPFFSRTKLVEALIVLVEGTRWRYPLNVLIEGTHGRYSLSNNTQVYTTNVLDNRATNFIDVSVRSDFAILIQIFSFLSSPRMRQRSKVAKVTLSITQLVAVIDWHPESN